MPKDAPSCIRELQKSGWYTELIGKTHWSNHRKSTDLRKNRELLEYLGFDKTNEIAGPRALQHVKCELTDLWEKHNLMDEYKTDLERRYKSGNQYQAWEVRPSILPNSLYPDVWVAAKGEKALRNMPQNKPWLLWISFVGPHEPFDTPRDWNVTSTRELPQTAKLGRWIERLSDETCLKRSYIRWNRLLNKKGQPLWATQIKRDPQEQENLIGIKNDFLKTNNSWARLLKIGQQEVKKRKSNEWLWRDCKL